MGNLRGDDYPGYPDDDGPDPNDPAWLAFAAEMEREIEERRAARGEELVDAAQMADPFA